MKNWIMLMADSYRDLLNSANELKITKEDVVKISYEKSLDCYILIYYK